MPVQKLASTQDAIRALEAYLEVIYERASDLTDEHWDHVYAYDQKMPDWRQRSRLLLRCRKAGNSLLIEWYEIRWMGHAGKRKCLRCYISKPRGRPGYNIDKLIPLAREWEVARVKETEAKMTSIRREAGQVNRALTALKAYVRAEEGSRAGLSLATTLDPE